MQKDRQRRAVGAREPQVHTLPLWASPALRDVCTRVSALRASFMLIGLFPREGVSRPMGGRV